MEHLISLQSAGRRSIGEPTAPRPIGVEQGSVLVVLDVNKGVSPGALYWALANVVRKGDNIKVLGIITHLTSAMGFMTRVDQSSRTNIMELQFEIATRKEAIWRIAHVKEWCQRAGVKMEVDVKAGNNPKVIAIDESKAMGAYHVILDKNMKKDRKYFVDNLTCFVSRFTSNGGVDTIRSFAMPMFSSNKLPPMAPSSQPGHQSKASVGSNASTHRGASSMSSTSFELGGESSDDYSAQEGDPLSAPSTGESLDLPNPLNSDLNLNFNLNLKIHTPSPNLYNLLRGPVQDPTDNLYNVNVNPLRKPTVRKWLNEDSLMPPDVDPSLTPRATEFETFRFEPQPLTPRNGQRVLQQRIGGHGWIGQLNVAPEMGQSKNLGRGTLTATLRTQASFNTRAQLRQDKVSMDLHWPLMHWAESRRGTKVVRTEYGSQVVIMASGNSMNNLRTAVRRNRVPVSSGLNYSDMVDSD